MSIPTLALKFLKFLDNVQGVPHFCGANSPWLSTKTMSTRPAVTRNAPIQSIRLSNSSEGTSLSIDTSPPMKQTTVNAARR